jgi:hypothetical protein
LFTSLSEVQYQDTGRRNVLEITNDLVGQNITFTVDTLSLWHLILILIVMDLSVDGPFHDVSTKNKPPVEYLRILKRLPSSYTSTSVFMTPFCHLNADLMVEFIMLPHLKEDQVL